MPMPMPNRNSLRALLLLVTATCTHAFESTLIGSRWRIKLNFELMPGSWMPNTIEGWGQSGGRAIVNADVQFDAASAGSSEELVGPADATRAFTVQAVSSLVTERGEEQIEFADGGWVCLLRKDPREWMVRRC